MPLRRVRSGVWFDASGRGRDELANLYVNASFDLIDEVESGTKLRYFKRQVITDAIASCESSQLICVSSPIVQECNCRSTSHFPSEGLTVTSNYQILADLHLHAALFPYETSYTTFGLPAFAALRTSSAPTFLVGP